MRRFNTSVSNYNHEYSLRDLAAGVPQTSSGEYPVVCPLCKARHVAKGEPDYNKKKLYINQNMNVSYCFTCNTVFIDKDVDPEDYKSRRRLSDLEKLEYKEPAEFKPIVYKFPSQPTEESIEYLKNRSPYYNVEEMQKDGFCPDIGKVIIKYMLDGENYFYQIRYLHPQDGRKYFIPVTDFKPVYFAKGEFNPVATTVLVEGAFSAYCLKLVVPEYNVIAIQGKTMTWNQVHQIETHGGVLGTVYIFLDETALSQNLKRHLQQSGSFGKLRVLRNDFGYDPEELSRFFSSKDEYRKYIIENTKALIM